MKKTLLSLVLMFPAFSYAEEVWIDGVKYTINGEEASITGYDESFSGVLDVDSISYNEKMYPVTSVGCEAFMYCTSLTSVSLPEATSIGESAFRYYFTSSPLTSVNLPKATTIGEMAFISCNALTSVSLPEATSIGESAFNSCDALTSVSLPKATTIGTWAFGSCDALTSVELPNVAPTIEDHTFDDNYKISIKTTSLEITGYTEENGYGNFYSIGYYYDKDPEFTYSICILDNKKNAKIITVKDIVKPYINTVDKKDMIFEGDLYSITKVGNYAFSGCDALTSVSLPNATSIGDQAFSNCDALTSVSLPNATSIGDQAFIDCDALTSASLPNATSIGDEVFGACDALTSVSLPNATSIGDQAFSNCDALTSVSLPNATSIGDQAFIDCDALTSASLPNATSIGDEVFGACDALTSVSLPNATNIGDNAFFCCVDLRSVSLPNATSIGDQAFSNCDALTSVSLPLATNIGSMAFYACDALTSVSLPLATNIGSMAFYNCYALTSVSLPLATNISYKTFHGCYALTSVSLPLATNIGSMAFYNCYALTSVSLPLATNIGDNAFSACDALTSVSLPSIAPTIQENTFDYLRSSISIFVPKGHSGYTAENGWTGFKYIGVLLIEIDYIKYQLESETSTAAVVEISDKTLSETTIKSTISYEADTYNVVFDQEAFIFAGCSNLTKITMPAQALPLSFYTFYGLDKSKISIYVDASEDEAEGYTPENGYEGFKEIIYMGEATGINPNEATEAKAYVDEYGTLHIEGISNMTEISVYNTMGSLVSKSNKQDLDVQLTSGVYFVRVGSKTIKVVAQ